MKTKDWKFSNTSSRGGVENTRLKAKTKDTKKFRGQGQDRPSRGQDHDRPSRGQGPRTQTQVFSKDTNASVFQFFFRRSQKKRSSKIFLGEKGFKNFFSGDIYLRKPKKSSLQIFHKFSGVFQRNFNGSKIVLSSSQEQGIFEGLRLRGQGL